MFKFPKVVPKKGTISLVLKAPKTESSIRMIYLPQSVVDELNKARMKQTEYKRMLGEEYCDYDLVVAQINGRPYEQRSIDKMFSEMISKHSLRPVVFHSLRHSSTSMKLKILLKTIQLCLNSYCPKMCRQSDGSEQKGTGGSAKQHE